MLTIICLRGCIWFHLRYYCCDEKSWQVKINNIFYLWSFVTYILVYWQIVAYTLAAFSEALNLKVQTLGRWRSLIKKLFFIILPILYQMTRLCSYHSTQMLIRNIEKQAAHCSSEYFKSSSFFYIASGLKFQINEIWA